MTSKVYYREHVKKLRENLTEDEKIKKDNIIYTKVVESSQYKNAECIFIYVSYKNEVDTHNIIRKALSDGKCICVPKIISLKEGMKAVNISDFNDLQVSKYGMLEPSMCPENIISPKHIDLVYLPGVAFDSKGGRIGYGGGFYDRFLSELNGDTAKIALAYSFQIFEDVPMDTHDIFIDRVISE